MAATDIQVVTGGDAFILTNPTIEKRVNIFNPSGKEFRLTITIAFEEFRQPSQPAKPLFGVFPWHDHGVITKHRNGRAS